MQVLWALMHNAIAATLVETRAPDLAFELARADQPRDLPRGDPPRRARQLADAARSASATRRRRRAGWRPAFFRTPREFMAGVGRLGHGLVREIYSLNDQLDVVGPARPASARPRPARPHDMPLTEDWLVDFSRFFAIGSSVPQRARALGPHVARPFATGSGVGTDGSADGLVLRDLIACSRGGLRSVRSLIVERDPGGAAPVRGVLRAGRDHLARRRGRLARRTPASSRARSTGSRPTRR